MPRLLFALTALLALSLSPALASPAQDLLTQVRGYLLNSYGGLSTADRTQLADTAQTQLNTACGSDANCPQSKAYPIVEQEISALKDEHSYFERPQDFQDFSQQATGGSRLQFGVRLGTYQNENRLVLDVVPGSAADSAGLLRGDILQTLDGMPYKYDQFSARRLAGQSVTLGVQRGAQMFNTMLTPGLSSTRELPVMTLDRGVAIITIPTFLAGGGVAQRVHDLVHLAQSEEASGVVIDLRDNGGGDLSECDLATSAFVPSFGRVAQNTDGQTRTLVASGVRREDGQPSVGVSNPALWQGPLAVLVNAASGSCSEFFAYELQYARRAVVVGEATAGVANSATRVFPLQGGAALQLTVTHYLKPDNAPYPERVTPSVADADDYAALAAGQDTQLQTAIAALKDAPSAQAKGN